MSTLYNIESKTEKKKRILNDLRGIFDIKRHLRRLVKSDNGNEYFLEYRLKQMQSDWSYTISREVADFSLLDFINLEYSNNQKSLKKANRKVNYRRIHTTTQYSIFLNELKNYIEYDKPLSENCKRNIDVYFPDFYKCASAAIEKLEERNQLKQNEVSEVQKEDHVEDSREEVFSIKNISDKDLLDEYLRRFPTVHPECSDDDIANLDVKALTLDYIIPVLNKILKTTDTTQKERNIIGALVFKNSLTRVYNSLSIYNMFESRKLNNTLELYEKVDSDKHKRKTIDDALALLKEIGIEILRRVEMDSDRMEEVNKIEITG